MTKETPKHRAPRDAAIWQRAEVDSPCVKICVIDPQARLCIGCLRTAEEIAQWSALDPAARQTLMEALPARQPRLADHSRRRGGRAARLTRDANEDGQADKS